MSESTSREEEAKEDAARALLNPSQVMLYALSHSLTPHSVRTRLMQHVSGVPPPPRPKSPVDPFQSTQAASPANANAPASSSSVPSSTLPTTQGQGQGQGQGQDPATNMTTTHATIPAPLGPPVPIIVPTPMSMSSGAIPLGDSADPIVAYVRRPVRSSNRGNTQ